MATRVCGKLRLVGALAEFVLACSTESLLVTGDRRRHRHGLTGLPMNLPGANGHGVDVNLYSLQFAVCRPCFPFFLMWSESVRDGIQRVFKPGRSR